MSLDGFQAVGNTRAMKLYSTQPSVVLTILALLAVLGGCSEPLVEPPAEELVQGCTDSRAENYEPNASEDDGSCEVAQSSAYFMEYARPEVVPGQFPSSECDDVQTHHECVTAEGCGWLRTIGNEGVCREDPVSRCLADGSCVCSASDFHGESTHDDDLEIFVPLSIGSRNLAATPFTTATEMEPLQGESLTNFTSRTDFSHRSLSVRADSEPSVSGLFDSSGLSLTLKFMHVWDTEPATISGELIDGLGLRLSLVDDRLVLTVGDSTYSIAGEDPGGLIKNYQCNQLAVVVPAEGDATVYLGGQATSVPGLDLSAMEAARDASDPLHVLRVGTLNAKVWDLRLYGGGRVLSADEVAEVGKRCGRAGEYRIPEGYPRSNERYSWGMGGSNIVPNHETQHFSSGVYTTTWIPEDDEFPPSDPGYRDDLHRMVGFWDRWHEQMFFELDLVPFVDTRTLEPVGSANTYRNYPSLDEICPDPSTCGEPVNYNNPCRYTTDMFQGFNWLPEDFPGEPTSADHRRISEAGGFGRWDGYDLDVYSNWMRPVHEHGHTAHFTLMRTYEKEHHYIRGIAGESVAEVMSQFPFGGAKVWMMGGLTYYPTIPLSFEGRWDWTLEEHVFQSPQPYQSLNIGDLGLGARFYGLGAWWTYVSHYAAMPYLIGRFSADTDETPGTTLQRVRFYLAQEQKDLGDLFGNFAAQVATWDWPELGHHYSAQEQDPFQGIASWCSTNTGSDCTLESLKAQAIHTAEGTGGEWIDGPEGVSPGGFAYNTIRIDEVPAGSLYRIGLEFDVPTYLYPESDYEIGLHRECREDPRFFSSRVVVAEEGTEGADPRPQRPQYYKIPGRSVNDVFIRTPEGHNSTIYLLVIPTPPFELEDVPGFVDGYSLTWPYRYEVERLEELPGGASVREPLVPEGSSMLGLDEQEGAGLVYDCFGSP